MDVLIGLMVLASLLSLMAWCLWGEREDGGWPWGKD